MNRLVLSGMALALGLGLTACAGPGADPADVRREIEQKNRRLESYIAQQDVDSILTLYTEDAITMPQGAEMIRGREAMRTSFQATIDEEFTGITFETMEVETAGDIAYEVGRYTVSRPGGAEVDHGKYVTIWKRVDGDWRIHVDIYNTDLAMPLDTTSAPADTSAVPADTTQ